MGNKKENKEYHERAPVRKEMRSNKGKTIEFNDSYGPLPEIIQGKIIGLDFTMYEERYLVKWNDGKVSSVKNNSMAIIEIR